MKRRVITLGVAFLLVVLGVQAQTSTEEELKYHRNSLATVLVYHPEDTFGINIYNAFNELPVPDKYDDHTIPNVRVIYNNKISGVVRNSSGFHKATYGHILTASEIQNNALKMEKVLNEAQMGKQMVAKWFGLNGSTVSDAYFNTELVQERGQYNASDVDVAVALQTVRGLATLSDAGEELLGQTFVLVNDITYVTAEQEAQAAKIAMGVIGGLLDAFTGGNSGRQLAQTAGQIADSFTGFKVKTHSYLFQLVWDDEVAATFYQFHYTGVPDSAKVQAFLNDRNTYRLKYVAHEYEFDKKSVLKGKYTRAELVRTICARSMDKNIVALAKQYEDFKVKTPVYSVLKNSNGKTYGYAAKIGKKEGITEGSKFQVVERVQDTNTGKSTYKYIATVKAKKGYIWDNRYNAVKEQGEGASLPYTTFTKVSGGEILPGMLLIEGKYRKVTQ